MCVCLCCPCRILLLSPPKSERTSVSSSWKDAGCFVCIAMAATDFPSSLPMKTAKQQNREIRSEAANLICSGKWEPLFSCSWESTHTHTYKEVHSVLMFHKGPVYTKAGPNMPAALRVPPPAQVHNILLCLCLKRRALSV